MSKFDEHKQEMASRLQKIEDRQDTMKQHIVQVAEQCEAKIENLSKENRESESVLRNEINAVKKKITNLQTNGIPSGSKLKTPLFDGTSSFSAFKFQFNVVATRSDWDEEEKAAALITSLRGNAADVIQIIPEARSKDFVTVMDALERKYGSQYVREVGQVELATRSQRPRETIREYANEIERLTNLTYVDMPEKAQEKLKIDAFMRGLRDMDIKKAVWTAPRTTFSETLGIALTQEAASVLWRSNEDQQLRNSVMRRCYNCQKPGHFARECRSRRRRTLPAAPTQASSDSTNTESLN
uniref:CCHC-type domain-containing protein n=1 Tax=Glossina brevipalpis TaxID=37001 RepID=A0A1A9X2Q8_9MUSC